MINYTLPFPPAGHRGPNPRLPHGGSGAGTASAPLGPNQSQNSEWAAEGEEQALSRLSRVAIANGGGRPRVPTLGCLWPPWGVLWAEGLSPRPALHLSGSRNSRGWGRWGHRIAGAPRSAIKDDVSTATGIHSSLDATLWSSSPNAPECSPCGGAKVTRTEAGHKTLALQKPQAVVPLEHSCHQMKRGPSVAPGRQAPPILPNPSPLGCDPGASPVC